MNKNSKILRVFLFLMFVFYCIEIGFSTVDDNHQKIKIFKNTNYSEFENEINVFLEDKILVDIKYASTVMIINSMQKEVNSAIVIYKNNIENNSNVIPDEFSFIDLNEQELSTEVMSNEVTLSGFENSLNANIIGDGMPKFRINGGDWETSFNNVKVGDKIELKLTTSNMFNQTHLATFTLGEYSTNWNVKTIIESIQEIYYNKNFGGLNADSGTGVSVDLEGNAYITGYFTDSITFKNITLISNGSYDIFTAKINSEGEIIYAKSFGSSENDLANSINIDLEGNSYITGYFKGSVNFGGNTLTSNGYNDIFVLKLNPNGNVIWAKNFGGSSNDLANSINIDSQGNSFITGYFQNTVDFGGNSLTSNGINDIFVLKLNSTGNVIWAKSYGGISVDSGNSISTDSQGNSYVIGAFRNTINVGNITLINNDNSNIFVLKIDSNGNEIWAKSYGGNQNNLGHMGNSIKTDSQGNSYLTGYFQETIRFGSTTLTSNGNPDIFVLKLDSNGNEIYAKSFGGIGNDQGNSISFDSLNNTYITGRFSNDINFRNITLTSQTSHNSFVLKLDSNGDFVDVKHLDGAMSNSNEIFTDFKNNIYVIGDFENTINFEGNNLTSNGSYDIFTFKTNFQN